MQLTGFSSYVAEIVNIGVSESEFDAILSEKFPPDGKRGSSRRRVLFSLW